MDHFTPLKEGMSSQGTHRQGQFAISILIDWPNTKEIVKGHLCLHFSVWERWKISVLTAKHNWGWHNVDSWKRPECTIQALTPVARQGNAKYPPRRNIDMPPHYGQEFIHCHRACAEIASALVVFLHQTKIIALSMGFFLLQGRVKKQGRFQVPCDGWRWKTQLHRGIFTTSS